MASATGGEDPSPSEGSDMLFARLVDSPTNKHDLSHRHDSKVVYLGESYNLNYVMHHLARPCGLADAAAEQETRPKQLHYFVPENIEIRARNVPRDLRFETEERETLVRKGALTVPPKGLSDALIQTFFRWIFPVFPIFDRRDFLSSYEAGKASLLVLQAIFFAAATHCDISLLHDVGFPSRHAARLAFYRRAQALFDADYEANPVATVQALCLLTLWCGGPLDQKDTWHWLGVAVGIAQSLGMHRCMRYSNIDQCHQRLWKRIWWSLYIRDIHAAAALGRPPHINNVFCDVECVEDEDFHDCGILRAILEAGGAQFAPGSDDPGRMPDPSLLSRDLKGWMDALPSSMACPKGEIALSEFWATILHITYHNYLILLYRSNDLSDVNLTDDAASIVSATKITRLLEDLLYSNLLHFAPISIISSLFAALTIHVRCILHRELSQTIQSEILEYRIRLCMLGLEKLQENWPVAAWTLHLFEQLMERLRSHQSASKRYAESYPQAPSKRPRTSSRVPQEDPLDLEGQRDQEPREFRDLGASESDIHVGVGTTPAPIYWNIEDTEFLSTVFSDEFFNAV
ncbi:Fungal specific transcription factor domain-containing protein [Cladophialophora immunda]|nr:Fungal specific transcription factor domain-containing protein [Cladophialophora immunda]